MTYIPSQMHCQLLQHLFLSYAPNSNSHPLAVLTASSIITEAIFINPSYNSQMTMEPHM
jgi:hypothetical protein